MTTAGLTKQKLDSITITVGTTAKSSIKPSSTGAASTAGVFSRLGKSKP